MTKIKQVILIDDDLDDRDIFIELLSLVDPNIKCTHFKNGEDFLNLVDYRSELSDLIFADLNMPKMSGIEFLHRVKESAQLADIPVLIVSTSSTDLDKQAALRAGAHGYITKATTLQQFRSNLSEWLKDFDV